MIARILDGHGVGSASAAIYYIAGDLNHNGEARDEVVHLFGDGQLVIDTTEAMTCKHRYLSSILSFTKEESDGLGIDEVRELAESFSEHHAYPFGTNNIVGCAYLHIQEGRYDIHLVQAQYDMESGKRVDLYLDQFGDTKRIGDWQDIQNFEHKLDDPRDPARQRLTKERIQEAGNRKEMRTLINTRLERMHNNREISSRTDVCQELKSVGFVIARQTKSSISITSPDLKQNIRLTGAIYHESYGGIKDSRRAIDQSERSTCEDRQKQYESARTRLEQSNKKRTERLSKKLNIELTERLQESYGGAEMERLDDLHSVLTEHRHSHHNDWVEPETTGIHQWESIYIDGLSDNDLPRANLRIGARGKSPGKQRWSIHDQGEIKDGNAPSYNKITNPFAILSRNQLHAATMRRVSQSRQSIKRASQRLGGTGDSERSTDSTTRRNIIGAIEQTAKGIARWISGLTGCGGTDSTPGPK